MTSNSISILLILESDTAQIHSRRTGWSDSIQRSDSTESLRLGIVVDRLVLCEYGSNLYQPRIRSGRSGVGSRFSHDDELWIDSLRLSDELVGRSDVVATFSSHFRSGRDDFCEVISFRRGQ